VVAAKVDFKRELTEFYAARRSPAVVQVPELAFLMIDGHGDPNTSGEYRDAVSAVLRLLRGPVRAQARGRHRFRDDAVGGAVVGERHVGVLERGQVGVGLDDGDHAAG
jgi:hypothetical protein